MEAEYTHAHNIHTYIHTHTTYTHIYTDVLFTHEICSKTDTRMQHSFTPSSTRGNMCEFARMHTFLSLPSYYSCLFWSRLSSSNQSRSLARMRSLVCFLMIICDYWSAFLIFLSVLVAAIFLKSVKPFSSWTDEVSPSL